MRRCGDERERGRLQLEEKLQQLEEELEQERPVRSEIQQKAEPLEQERLRLEHELGPSKEESGGGPSGVRPWWRRPVLVTGLLIGWRLSRVVYFPGGSPDSAVSLNSSLPPRVTRSSGHQISRRHRHIPAS
jgi:hypothetical protein